MNAYLSLQTNAYECILDWSVYTCLTQLYDGRDMYIIYYIKNNYMFRPSSMAIFRLINEKKLVSSYTRFVWIVYTQVEYSCLLSFFHLSTWRWPMKRAKTCSCSLCNKFYTYLCHHIVVLGKYIHSNLVYYKHKGDDKPYVYMSVS